MKKKKLPKMRNLVVVHMIKRKCGAHKKTHKQLRGKLNHKLED
jgi:hypothetical protein